MKQLYNIVGIYFFNFKNITKSQNLLGRVNGPQRRAEIGTRMCVDVYHTQESGTRTQHDFGKCIKSGLGTLLRSSLLNNRVNETTSSPPRLPRISVSTVSTLSLGPD